MRYGESKEPDRFGMILLCLPGLLVFVLPWFVASFYEWYRIGVVADWEVIADYHFGSEAMIHHGGENYRSREAYARSVFTMMLSSLLVGAWLIFAWLRKSSLLAVLAYATFFVLLLLGCGGV